MLTSQALALATAMAVSAGTILLFDLYRGKYFSGADEVSPDGKQVLKSSFSSGNKKRMKKKRVRFADDVKDSPANGELYRKQHRKSGKIERVSSCGNEIQKMPSNRMALYSGILRDRVHRTQYSY